MLAVNNVDEIKAVRTLYVCQISIVDQSEGKNIIHWAIVAIRKIIVTIVLFCHWLLLIRFPFLNPKKNNRTANRQRIIVVDDKMMSKSCVPLISYD